MLGQTSDPFCLSFSVGYTNNTVAHPIPFSIGDKNIITHEVSGSITNIKPRFGMTEIMHLLVLLVNEHPEA